MRIIGLDVGEKRIGVARVDSDTKISVPVGTIPADDSKWEEISRLARLYDTNFFVLGLPRNNAGNETAQSLYVRNFAKTLTEKIPGIKIRFQDESLTSVEAEQRLKARKVTYKKSEIDVESATIILQDFIENFRETPLKNPNPKKINLIEKNTQKAMLKSKKVVHKSKKLTKFFIIPPIIFIIFLLLFGCYMFFQLSLSPVTTNCQSSTCDNIIFTVNKGETIDTIAKNLKKSGLIRNPLVFKLYQRFRSSNSSLKSGTYSLNPGLSAPKIITILTAGAKDSNVFSFTILPGETIFNIQKNLLKIGYEASEIKNAFQKSYPSTVFTDKPISASLEGYLFGQTFEFYQGATVEDILSTFLTNFEKVIIENDFTTQFAKKGLSLHEGIILASIVQKEAYANDQPTVAQVFFSRLASGKHLGSDVTIKYALDLDDPNREIYTNNASALKINSCYNTSEAYGHSGLPCGPISSPSLSALNAVANPSNTTYLYFLTGDDGKMYYGNTPEEHKNNRRLYCKKLCDTAL